jgi:hypothetical protein
VKQTCPEGQSALVVHVTKVQIGCTHDTPSVVVTQSQLLLLRHAVAQPVLGQLGGVTHCPFLQIIPDGQQILPHACLAGQHVVPLRHTCPDGQHVVPQAWPVGQQVVPLRQVPSQQELLQLIVPGGQHKPLTHSPDTHTVPHTPQFLGSVLVFTHLPWQNVRPGRQRPVMAKTRSSPLKASMLPKALAARVLTAWRREVGVASDLVSSSNLVGSISIHSFVNECDSQVTPPGHIPPEASIMPPSLDLEDILSSNLQTRFKQGSISEG